VLRSIRRFASNAVPINNDQELAMKKMISGVIWLLMTLPALADEAAVVVAPQVDADPTGLILFALVFVGMIGGFAAYIWVKERDRNGPAK